jgi:hypothetical protein
MSTASCGPSQVIVSFELQEDRKADAQMWYLREKISGWIFEVVSKDPKLTNCFWNFSGPHPREE